MVCWRRHGLNWDTIPRYEKHHFHGHCLHAIACLVAIFSNGACEQFVTTQKSPNLTCIHPLALCFDFSILIAWVTADFSPSVSITENDLMSIDYFADFFQVQLSMGLYETTIIEKKYTNSTESVQETELTLSHWDVYDVLNEWLTFFCSCPSIFVLKNYLFAVVLPLWKLILNLILLAGLTS